MLVAKPKSIFTWGFDVFYGNAEIASIDTSWIREKGSFHFEGNNYQLVKAGAFSKEFSLLENGETIATATKTTLIRSFEVNFGKETYILRAAHPITRKFVVELMETTVGTISPEHPFTRRCQIELPESIPIPVQMFMFWLVLLMWRRASNAGAAS